MTGISPVDALAALAPLADATSLTGSATATLEASAIETVAHGDPLVPVTVTSYDPEGAHDVTVEDVSRIVAVDIAGSITATLAALDMADSIVGTDGSAEVAGLEDAAIVTSSGHSVNPEAILALAPSVVITDGTVGPVSAFTQLEDAGVSVVFVDAGDGFEGAQELARQVGEAVGLADAGDALAIRIATEVDEVRALVDAVAPVDASLRPRVAFLYLRGSAGVYYLFGSEGGADQLIEALGGIDVAAEIGVDGMIPLTDEAMLAADPDVLLVMTDGLESVGGVEGLVALRPAIGLTSAGQAGRVIAMEDRLLLGFGPRSADVLAALAVALYTPGS